MTCQPWPIAWPCSTEGVDPALLDAAADLAGQLIWSLSGYRIGVCSYREAFRPATTAGCGAPYKDASGNWRNGGQQGACCRVLLSHRPVGAILEVRDGGVVLDSTAYALEGSWLRRRGACWTTSFACDDPELIVVYQAGVPFPAGTAAAVGEVACEYLSALQGGQCRLPSRATSITRQGVTVTLDTAADFVNRRRIGLPITDAWLESVAGSGPRVASKVYSPDVARGIPVAGAVPVPATSGSVPFSWRQSDPVNKVVIARDGVAHGWLGVYQSQLRSSPDSSAPLIGTFTVTATAVGPDVRLDFVLTEAESIAIPTGSYYWDAQQEGGPTRLTGTADVLADITVLV
jgi:hypothetical protein